MTTQQTLRAGVATIAAIVAASIGAAGTGAATTAGSHNPQVFADPTGDSGSGPDIATVTIRNTAAGVIRFDIAVPNAGQLLPDDSVVAVFLDTDRNASTGSDGSDYTIQTTGSTGTPVLGHWDGTNMVAVDAPSLAQIWVSGGTISFQISRSDLGGIAGFRAWAATGSTTGDQWDDVAPDGDAMFDYTLSMPQVTSAKARFSPVAPRAGRGFAVSGVTFNLQTGEKLPAAQIRCRATLAGKPLQGTGAGGCTFSLPRTSRGNRLDLVIVATLAGETRTIHTTLRVR
jgi:hypothetical protein